MTTTLEPAYLEELDKNGKVVTRNTLKVQFNPHSLKLQMANSIDGAKSRGRQVQQYNGTSSTTLSVELEFDTADEGTTGRAVNVRTRTAAVARFVLPAGKESKQAPPRVQFRWGALGVAGVMTSLSEELDLFSAQGVPLRAKVGIEIKEQDPKYEARANPRTAAPPAGENKDAVDAGSGNEDRTDEALDGESASDFLARNGLAPAAWRAIAGALDNPLSLSAGVAVDFSASLSVEAGIGVSAGFGAELEVSAGVSLGLEAGGGGGVAAGIALAAAGGITAADQAAAGAQAIVAADGARAAFGRPVGRPAPPVADSTRAPLAMASTAGTPVPAPAAPRPAPALVDARAVSFGRGVPLRDRLTPPDVGAGTGGYVVVAPRTPAGAAPQRARAAGTASWERLPHAAAADAVQQRRRPGCGCAAPVRGCRP